MFISHDSIEGCIDDERQFVEVVASYVTAGRFQAVVVVVYRPGSQPVAAVSAQFFNDLTHAAVSKAAW